MRFEATPVPLKTTLTLQCNVHTLSEFILQSVANLVSQISDLICDSRSTAAVYNPALAHFYLCWLSVT